MKITSLTLQAFRGFNHQVTFQLANADIIILYGPNGHGKSSVYDAIEWALTGRIHRFEESSAERNRTRFIRNLNADSSIESFVKLGIVLSESQHFTIERKCTATARDSSDYGKHALTIWDESDQLYKKDKEAEETLQKWLIHSDWLSKISSPTKMLSLTHLLSQEKISEFLKGMKERERYEHLSILFGTDHFDKYRESFRNTKSELNSQSAMLEKLIEDRRRQKDKLQYDVTQLETQVKQNKDTNYNEALQDYLKIYPNIAPDKENLEKLQASILKNQQDVEVHRKKTHDDCHVLKEIDKVLPRIEELRKMVRTALHKQQELQHFKQSAFSKIKINQLLTEANKINTQVETTQQLIALKNESISKMDSLLVQRSNKTRIKEILSIQLATSSWREQQTFLLDLKGKMNQVDYEVVQSLFSSMFKKHEIVIMKESMRASQLVQLEKLEVSINEIKDTRKIYHAFLSSLSEYITTTSDLDSCPACGTKGINKSHIQQNIQQQREIVDENLPRLEELNIEIKQTLRAINNDIEEANKHISESQLMIQEILHQYEGELKSLGVMIASEQQVQLDLQQKINMMQLNLKQFKEGCQTLGIELDGNVEQQLKLKSKEYAAIMENINSPKMSHSESESFLEPIQTMKFQTSNIDEHEQTLQQIVDSNELEINRIILLTKSLQTIELDLQQTDRDELCINVKRMIRDLKEKLARFTEMEEANIKLRSIIEFSSEKKRLIRLQKQSEVEKKQITELENKQIKLNRDLEILTELINQSTVAVSNLNEKVFLNLKETIQAIFEQINSHPVFTKLDLVQDRRNHNNCLRINVGKTNDDGEVKANAPYIFSSAQVNSIALSLFLAMSLKQRWSPLQLIGMDDPIQSMDEINLLTFIDLIRLFVEKHQKQVIISTHDHKFYKMMLKKFRYYDLAIIEYKTYGDGGPIIDTPDEEGINHSRFQPKLNYNQAKQKLMQLDTNE
ncbi:AAA family ATPase [Bacillus mycoides]|uniref:AAA family ATPase n=1 Tax=Bacillus mycoides TaxID=1405 RepID=UPI0011EDBDE9|nr:AAA family ATPase [Bacillus mycoides]QEL85891.1 hypothetical protein DN409_16505 [Bacillus mycoides]